MTRIHGRELRMQLEGYGLTTAEIHYRMPDHPGILQTYIWQEYDLAPEFPELRGFLEFWKAKLHGPLHSVRVAHQHLIRPSEWKAVDGIISIH
ncbi:protein usg [Xinfangfangia sp. D13-10-4-6]|uniref:usg protein n=1 Tax=Pseudogemmobacter hezensis TaxID=2737662 RepID=UPI00155563C0|nr:usg protein [Pseudogemmobacter hezensis]NPD14925.1 protein usg [Pseudogemmobacter hezensis]